VQALGTPHAGDQLLFLGAMAGKQMFNTRIWKVAVEAANSEGACEAAGLVPIGKRPNIHDLRHTHASWLIHAGGPLPFVQACLGHEKITTTVDTYGDLLPDAHLQKAQIMAETMSNVLPVIAVAE